MITRVNRFRSREQNVAKDSKKKKKGKKGSSDGALSGKVAKRLRDISKNPMIADIVAATLVGAASALKDSKKARQLAANAGDELEALAARGAKQGNALWKLALDVGQKSLEALGGDVSPATKTRKAKPKKAKARPRASAAKAATRTSATKASPRASATKASPRASATKRAKPKAKTASSPRKRQSRKPASR